jgi:hypothetical protein
METAIERGIGVFGLVREDRELFVAVWLAVVGEHQLPDGVIQGGSQIVDQFADDDPPVQRRLGGIAGDAEYEAMPGRIGVELVDDYCLLVHDPRLTFRVKSVSVLLGTFDLEADPGQPVDHAARRHRGSS